MPNTPQINAIKFQILINEPDSTHHKHHPETMTSRTLKTDFLLWNKLIKPVARETPNGQVNSDDSRKDSSNSRLGLRHFVGQRSQSRYIIFSPYSQTIVWCESQPADNPKRARYLFRKKTLVSSFLRGPAAECYADSVDAADSWAQIRTGFYRQIVRRSRQMRHRFTAEIVLDVTMNYSKTFVRESKAPLINVAHMILKEINQRAFT